MKGILLAISGVFVLAACNNNADPNKLDPGVINNPVSATSQDTAGKSYPKVKFYEEAFDFGKIKQGDKVQHLFKFKNTGTVDLIITSAEGSCGCTVPEYSKEPVKPGQESSVNVIFNSEGKSGSQHKSVTIIANTYPNITKVHITGEVEAPAENK